MVKTVHSPIIRRAVVIDVKISPLENETRKFNKNLLNDSYLFNKNNMPLVHFATKIVFITIKNFDLLNSIQ